MSAPYGRQATQRSCIVCGKAFVPRKSNAVTCSSACRQKGYRQRRAKQLQVQRVHPTVCDTYRELFDLVKCLCDTAQETIRVSALQKQLCKEAVAVSRALLENNEVIQQKIIRTKFLTSDGILSLTLLKKVQDHVGIHLNERLTIADLAGVARLDPSNFSRAFKRTVGIGPQRYLVRQRLERAKLLMQSTDETLAWIAQESGFTNQSHLSVTFRRETGMTPGRFRKSLASTRTGLAPIHGGSVHDWVWGRGASR